MREKEKVKRTDNFVATAGHTEPTEGIVLTAGTKTKMIRCDMEIVHSTGK
jgi:hypothetical protein